MAKFLKESHDAFNTSPFFLLLDPVVVDLFTDCFSFLSVQTRL